MEQAEFTVHKVSVAMGAGIWVKRWAVLQDGAVREWFVAPGDAEVFADSQRRDWGSHDE